MRAKLIVGSVAASAIGGRAETLVDQLLMALVVLAWDYAFHVLGLQKD